MPLFRAHFDGPPDSDAPTLSDMPRVEREGSRGRRGFTRHYFLIEARTEDEAMAVLSDAVAEVDAFDSFAAIEVTPPPGWPGLNRRSVDWESVVTRCDLSELDQALLRHLLDAAEPTWIVLQDPATGGDRQVVEAACLDLERRGLVTRTPEGNIPGAAELPDRDDWWMLTDQGWAILGLIKRPWYH